MFRSTQHQLTVHSLQFTVEKYVVAVNCLLSAVYVATRGAAL